MDANIYEANLERIYAEFGRVALVPLLSAAVFVGADWRTLRDDKKFPTKKIGRRYYVGSVALARWLS